MAKIEKDENLVDEVVEETNTSAENTETTAEETPKTYTEAELNARVDELLGKKIARKESKIRKEYERKYGYLEDVLRAGTGKDDVSQATDSLKEFYQQSGVTVPEKEHYTPKDIELLARAEADDIIRAGEDEVKEEVERLTEIGAAGMTEREKAVFKVLAEHRQNTERQNELRRIGVAETVQNSKEFQDFAGQFNKNVPITEIYKLYAKTVKPENIEKIGSMKNGAHDEGKTYYSPEDVDKLSSKDLDNPEIFKRVHESMKSWK